MSNPLKAEYDAKISGRIGQIDIFQTNDRDEYPPHYHLVAVTHDAGPYRRRGAVGSMAEAVRTNSNASANLKKGEFGYPAGHLGHLTQNEEAALLGFKRLLVEKKLLKEDNGEGEGTDVDDVTLL